MSDTIWITTKYPEPYIDVIVFDLYSGTHLAYYDNITNTFYDKQTGESLPYASAWMKSPIPPTTSIPLRQAISSRYVPKVNVLERETNDKGM